MVRAGAFLACACVLGLAIAQPATGAIRYAVTDLGCLPGGDVSEARGINAHGVVVGDSASSEGARAFRWRNGVMTSLGVLPGKDASLARDVNDSGQIVGTCYNISGGSSRAFRWQNGVMTDLGLLPGGSSSEAYAINAAGKIVGDSGNPPGGLVAFLWQSGTMTSLGNLPGGVMSKAYAINASDQIVGLSHIGAIGSDTAHAFLYQGGTMTDLGRLPGDFCCAVAWAINTSGQIAGTSFGADDTRGFLYQNGAMTDLGDPPASGFWACGIGKNGTIVGYSGHRAYLWDATNGLQDLTGLLNSTGSGWVLQSANAINDSGKIVGVGSNPDDRPHAFLLTPTNEPDPTPADPVTGCSSAGMPLIASILGGGLALLGAARARRRR